jgi:hypothetical protein
MNLRAMAARARRVFSKPPSYVARRILGEIDHTLAGFTQPAFGRNFGMRDLLRRTGAADATTLWNRLVENSRRCFPHAPTRAELEQLVPGETARIIAAAHKALRNEIDLLGSGPIELGKVIDWHRDYKTGDRWPVEYFRKTDYINVGRPSDVKTVWELSRMQWLLPCAQAWRLTGEERYAHHVRETLEQWIKANPYTCGVNWGVTMEPAMRLITWTWMLRTCADSAAFGDVTFRERFMRALFLHGLFTERYFERSDVNGNHFTADAAALVLVGALFGAGKDAARWLATGRRDVEHEIALQVHPDGVDFEASSAYHRLVAELFLIASMALTAVQQPASDAYRHRLAAMARFTTAYSRPDGLAPLWGDNDDARSLPLGGQALRDHRYLVGLIGLHLRDDELIAAARGPRAEAAWLFGAEAAGKLAEEGALPASSAFRHGGVYVLRDRDDYLFIDCGPIGLAGRGGHGHNDLLSFEATLAGVPLVTEGGCFVYTADDQSRDIDRGTRSHNTPMVDGQELNRFMGPEYRWNLHDDARHQLMAWAAGEGVQRFVGRHTGFERLPSPVTVERTIELAQGRSEIRVHDRFLGSGTHLVEEPLHLAAGVTSREEAPGSLILSAAGREFALTWDHEQWRLGREAGREAASYGRATPVERLIWSRRGALADFNLHIAVRGAHA